jgi:hypothetical protein
VPQTLPNPLVQARAAGEIREDHDKFDGPALLRFWHLTSLDAPTVAAVWTLGFAWAAGVRLPLWVPILVALAAWAAYIVDRLLDARTALRTANVNSLRERHRFHHRHRGVLIPVAAAAAFVAAWIVFTLMPSAARERNSLLALAALVYFTSVHSPGRPPFGFLRLSRLIKKEMMVGLLFTAACALPAISRAATHANQTLWPICAAAVAFALLAWLNCHAIDRWEVCEREPVKSRIVLPACLLAFTCLLLAAILSATEPRPAALIVTAAVSAVMLALLDRLRSRLTPLAVRAGADLVLLAPLALLLK